MKKHRQAQRKYRQTEKGKKAHRQAENRRRHGNRHHKSTNMDDAPSTPRRPRHSCAINMLAAGCSVTDIKNHLGHEDVQSSMVYLQMDLPRRRKIQKRFTEYTQAVLSRNAEIEALIDKQEEDDVMTWLDSL
ncbi:MAG: tyrosine-type recombinase/integrase [Desulfobacterales bacterium]